VAKDKILCWVLKPQWTNWPWCLPATGENPNLLVGNQTLYETKDNPKILDILGRWKTPLPGWKRQVCLTYGYVTWYCVALHGMLGSWNKNTTGFPNTHTVRSSQHMGHGAPHI
jgi:hypothetical protein